MRHKLLIVLGVVAFAVPQSEAQVPLVANATPMADFLRSGGVEPDTTSPWRYFPLAVGNAWEYGIHPTGLPDIDLGTRRVDIEKDTLIGETRYFIYRSRFYDADGVPSGSGPRRTPIRFDTLTATVREPFMGGERIFNEADCPFDAPFGEVVLCGDDGDRPFHTYGGYDEGTLSFPDTSFSVTYKGYSSSFGFVTSYAADYGRFALSFDNGDTLILEYVRVDGEEYGVPQFPVANDPTPPEKERLRLEAWPNPFRERLTVAVEAARPEALRLVVFDVRGRRIHERALGHLPPGRHEVALDGSALAPGLYVLRLSGADGGARTRPVVRLR